MLTILLTTYLSLWTFFITIFRSLWWWSNMCRRSRVLRLQLSRRAYRWEMSVHWYLQWIQPVLVRWTVHWKPELTGGIRLHWWNHWPTRVFGYCCVHGCWRPETGGLAPCFCGGPGPAGTTVTHSSSYVSTTASEVFASCDWYLNRIAYKVWRVWIPNSPSLRLETVLTVWERSVAWMFLTGLNICYSFCTPLLWSRDHAVYHLTLQAIVV